MKSNNSNNNGFSAEKFVDDLLNEASQIPCDESLSEFRENEELPKYYNEEKFKRAQKFFKDNIFAMYFNKLLGLIVTLASPSVLNILHMTKMSGCVMSSYRRYLATLFHMNIWYRDELSANSSSMKSIKTVKSMHNIASKKAVSLGMHPITQKDMVLTQFGFMGFAISRTEMIGIHNASDADLESLVHFWRIIGHVMGIQERFNLCRDSLEETKEICEVLIRRVLRPLYLSKDKRFLEMTSYLVNGMWHSNPMLHFRTFLTYLNDVMEPIHDNNNEKSNNNDQYFELSTIEQFYMKFIYFVIFTLKFKIIRTYLNVQQNVSLWLMKVYPFLAVYSFGYRNSIVSVDEHMKVQ